MKTTMTTAALLALLMVPGSARAAGCLHETRHDFHVDGENVVHAHVRFTAREGLQTRISYRADVFWRGRLEWSSAGVGTAEDWGEIQEDEVELPASARDEAVTVRIAIRAFCGSVTRVMTARTAKHPRP